MAFPSFTGTAAIDNGNGSTNQVADLPGSIVSGELLLMVIGTDGNTTITFDTAGWTKVFSDIGSGPSLVVFGRIADGTEGSTVQFDISASEQWASIGWRIQDHGVSTVSTDVYNATTTGTSANPRGPTLTPSPGAQDYLWISTMSADRRTHTSYPTDSTTGEAEFDSVGSQGVSVATAARTENSAGPEQLNAHTIASSDTWCAATLAIPPTQGTDDTAEPDSVDVNITLPQAVRQGGATRTAGPVSVASSVGATSGTVAWTVILTPVAVDASLPQVTVTAEAGADATRIPAAIAVDVTLPQAVRRGGASRTVVHTVTVTLPQAVRSGGATRVLTPVSVTTEIPQVVRSGGATRTTIFTVAVTLPQAVRSGGATRTVVHTVTITFPQVLAGASKTVEVEAVEVAISLPQVVRSGGATRTVWQTLPITLPQAERQGGASRSPAAIAVDITLPQADTDVTTVRQVTPVAVDVTIPQAVRSGGASRTVAATVVEVTLPQADTDVTTVRPVPALVLAITVPLAVRSGGALRVAELVTVSISLPQVSRQAHFTQTVTPVTVNITLPQVTVTTGGAPVTVEPESVVVNVTLPQAEPIALEVATPESVTVAITVPQAVRQGGATRVVVHTVAVSLPQVVRSGGATRVLEAVAVDVTLPQVTVSTTGDITVTPAAIVVAADVPQVVRSGGALRVTNFTVAVSVPQVVRSGGATRVAVFTVAVSLPQADASVSKTITGQVPTVAITVPQAVRGGGATRTVEAVVVAVSLPQAVRQGGATRTVSLTVNITLPQATPLTPISATITPDPIVVTATLPQVTIGITDDELIVLTPITVSTAVPSETGIAYEIVTVAPVSVSIPVPSSVLTTEIAATVRLQPVVLTSTYPARVFWTGLIDLTVPETGVLWRDPADPMLSLGYGGRRTMTRTWANTDEAWERVSIPFLFESTQDGKALIDAAVVGEWTTDKDSDRLVLFAKINQALQNAGFRKPNGDDLVSHTSNEDQLVSTSVSIPQVTVTTT